MRALLCLICFCVACTPSKHSRYSEFAAVVDPHLVTLRPTAFKILQLPTDDPDNARRVLDACNASIPELEAIGGAEKLERPIPRHDAELEISPEARLTASDLRHLRDDDDISSRHLSDHALICVDDWWVFADAVEWLHRDAASEGIDIPSMIPAKDPVSECLAKEKPCGS